MTGLNFFHSRGGSELNCQRVVELIHPYIDRELDRDQVSEVERHLEQCEDCNLSYCGQIALRSSLHDSSFYYCAPAHLKTRIASSFSEETKHDAHTVTFEVTSR
jgi:anti-sigma factor RsiW